MKFDPHISRKLSSSNFTNQTKVSNNYIPKWKLRLTNIKPNYKIKETT